MKLRRQVVSRIAGFYQLSRARRLQHVLDSGLLSERSSQHLATGGPLDPEIADLMSENVIASLGLPFALALNFQVNGQDVLVPMAIEEPSVVAGASNAAKLIRVSGGFVGRATDPITTAQIQLDDVPDTENVEARILASRQHLLALGDRAIPNIVDRGGGCRDLEVRVLDATEGLVVVHVHVHVGDAMGANIVDTVAEVLAPPLRELAGGQIGLRILTNLGLRRMVRVEACVSTETIGGEELTDAIARASRFAERDPFRAVTHNKGIMNGVDAIAVALGQDWRAIEAGAHGFAALHGSYRPLSTWTRTDDGLRGVLEMPLAAATVGGSTNLHPGVRAAFEILGVVRATDLAIVMGAAGLASNLAALRALAGEGIQRGHMRLHDRKRARDATGANHDD